MGLLSTYVQMDFRSEKEIRQKSTSSMPLEMINQCLTTGLLFITSDELDFMNDEFPKMIFLVIISCLLTWVLVRFLRRWVPASTAPHWSPGEILRRHHHPLHHSRTPLSESPSSRLFWGLGASSSHHTMRTENGLSASCTQMEGPGRPSACTHGTLPWRILPELDCSGRKSLQLSWKWEVQRRLSSARASRCWPSRVSLTDTRIRVQPPWLICGQSD